MGYANNRRMEAALMRAGIIESDMQSSSLMVWRRTPRHSRLAMRAPSMVISDDFTPTGSRHYRPTLVVRTPLSHDAVLLTALMYIAG